MDKHTPLCIEYQLTQHHLFGQAQCHHCNNSTSQPPTEKKLKLKLDSTPFTTQKQEDSSQDSLPDDEAELALMLMEKFNDCACCKGDVYNCQDLTCANLGACFCMIQDQLESQDMEYH